MVKPRKITLIALLLMGCLMGQLVSAQDPLTQHFVSADGTLQLDYPQNWRVQDTLGSIILSNTANPFDETGVVPGAIFAVLFIESLDGSLPPQVEKTLWSAMEHSLMEAESAEDAPEYGDVVELPIGGHPSYHSHGVSDTQDALILVLDLGGGYFGELSVVTAPGELALFQETLVAILASIQFTPLSPPVIAGSVVWQKTGGIGAVDSPDNYLIGVAIGPDDRIYTADSDTIFVFGPDGSGPQVIEPQAIESQAIESQATEAEAVSGIRDLAVSADGGIWIVSHTMQRVILLDETGAIVRSWGEAGQGAGQFGPVSPLQIEIGPDGNVYLLDANVDANGQAITQIQVWSAEGEYLRAFPLDEDLLAGEIRMAFGPDGFLNVLDMNVLYQTDGRQVSENIATGRLSIRNNLGVALGLDANNQIYISTVGGVILQQDTHGTYLQQFGTLQVYPITSAGDPPFVRGEFARPQGVAVLSNGDVVVVDANFDYWQVVRLTFPSVAQE